MGDLAQLVQQLNKLDISKCGKKDVLDCLRNLTSAIDNSEIDNEELCSAALEVANFLNCELEDVRIKSAEVLAEICKTEAPRMILSANQYVIPLIGMLSSSSADAQIQSCRAIGNICFDNNEGRTCVLSNNGLIEIVNALKKCVGADCSPSLRTNSAGCLLNVIMAQDHVYPKLIEMGIMDVLCDILSHDIGTKQAEDTAVHIYVILSLLTDSAPGTILLNERLCKITVQILALSTNGELSELCVELLHSQAENEEVCLHLARAGLCELLIELLEKHCRLADDDETRNLLKMACDLIIIILNGDASMEIAYGNGKGKVFEGLLRWLDSSDDDLQVTAVLAMANFARTDTHCIQMLNLGVGKSLLSLLSQNNTSEAKIRLQHALLSALRNLAIPQQNKPILLQQGLFQAIYPMLSIPTFPVVFKLLGTLRMVIDGQPEAANELGSKDEVLTKLVEWCMTEDHPGVQGEANRLLARIIKNSRDREVIGKMVSQGAVECLVKMITTEHSVMQAEAFLALNLTAAIRGTDAEPSLIKSNVGEVLCNYLSAPPPKEVFHNLLSLVAQLGTSGEMKAHLKEAGLPKVLKTVASHYSLVEFQDQVARLTTTLDSG